jgi:hypothetical protein
MGIKKGVRVLAYAESFDKKYDKSILVGLVMRRDLIIDGFIIGTTTLGGLDSTDIIIRLYKELNREDIGYIMLSGVVISWFNVVDLNRLYNEVKLPIIALSYEETEGILKYYKEYFPNDWERRVEIHNRNGERERLLLHTGYKIFFRYIGIDRIEAEEVLNAFTLEGKYPEPVRVAKLIARGVLNSIRKGYINLLR